MKGLLIIIALAIAIAAGTEIAITYKPQNDTLKFVRDTALIVAQLVLWFVVFSLIP